MDLLDGISNKALEYFTNQVEEPSSLFNFSNQQAEFKSRFQYAQTLEAMGEVAYSRGKTIEAFTAFENARTRLEALLKIQPNNLELLTLAGANAFWLGQLHYDKSDYAATEPLFKKYHAYSEKMYSLAPNDFNSIMELSYSHNSLGSLYLKQFNYTAAKQSFTKSLALKNKALKLKPNNKNLLRDKADTISWLAKTEEGLGDFNAALTMYVNASSELSNMLLNYPDDASLSSSLAYTYIQQSYLLSYLPNRQAAYEKAQQATNTINNAILQDPKSKYFQDSYYRFLAYQLMLSADKNINEQVNEIIKFVKNQYFDNKFIINTQVSLIHYFIDRLSQHKAQELLIALESDTNYQEYIANQMKIGDNIIPIRVNLLKAKLSTTSKQREQFCLNALQAIIKTAEKDQSVRITYPLVQVYTCLNRADEIPKIKANLVKLGITNFKL
jgi:tetratricopeptide (TPR) repeat protein